MKKQIARSIKKVEAKTEIEFFFQYLMSNKSERELFHFDMMCEKF